jgi:hypothetical protein
MRNISLVIALAATISTPAFAQDAVSAWVDGRLTAAEYQSLARARFGLADADRNGAVSAAEFTAIYLAEFDRADRNKDGVIRRGEIRGLAPTTDNSALSAGITRAQSQDFAAKRFAQLDKDKNASVTEAEYLAQLQAEFSQGDLNKDGALTRGELRKLTPTNS